MFNEKGHQATPGRNKLIQDLWEGEGDTRGPQQTESKESLGAAEKRQKDIWLD